MGEAVDYLPNHWPLPLIAQLAIRKVIRLFWHGTPRCINWELDYNPEPNRSQYAV